MHFQLLDRLWQWRGAVREYHGDRRDDENSRFAIPSHILWREFAFVNEIKDAPPASRQHLPVRLLWNMRVLLVQAPLLHIKLRMLPNGEHVGGHVYRAIWNDRVRPFRRHHVSIPVPVVRRLASLESVRGVEEYSRARVSEPANPRSSPAPASGSPGTLAILVAEGPFALRLDRTTPLTHFDAVLLVKVHRRQQLNEEEFMELCYAWGIFTQLERVLQGRFSRRQEVLEPIPGPSNRPPTPEPMEADVIVESFFTLGVDNEPVTPSEGTLEKVGRGEKLDDEEFGELKDVLEVLRLWQKYIQDLSSSQ